MLAPRASNEYSKNFLSIPITQSEFEINNN